MLRTSGLGVAVVEVVVIVVEYVFGVLAAMTPSSIKPTRKVKAKVV